MTQNYFRGDIILQDDMNYGYQLLFLFFYYLM